MARDKETPNISRSNLEKVQSSEDLLKSAWSSIGLNDKTEKTRKTTKRQRSDSGSLSAGMATTAGSAASATSAARAETAEDIARMLAEETQRRNAARTSSSSRTQSRQAAPPPRVAAPPPRPRRVDEEAPPSTRVLQPPPAPQPARAPQPQTMQPQPMRPQPTQPEPQQRSTAKSANKRGIGWLVFAGIWVISAIIGAIGGDSSNNSPDTSIGLPDITIDVRDLTSSTLGVDGDVTNIRDVLPGACIDSLPLGDVIDDVVVVDCADRHQYEVFAVTNLDDSPTTYPGFDLVVDSAYDACSVYFFDYVGETYASSEWYVDVITPTEAGWNKSGDRVVNCLLYIWDDDLGDAVYVTGTAEGSGDAAS